MIMKAVRLALGNLIVAADAVSRPAKQQRSAEAQSAVDLAAKDMSLYQFHACPFCVKTRRALHKLNVSVELRDAKNNQQHRQALLEQGGRIKVPCLRIDSDGASTWLYESSDIISYLNQRFAAA